MHFFAIGGLCGEGQPSRRALPGVQPGGAILLPNQWSIRPAGKQLELGDFPVNLAIHPRGEWLAALHSGYGEHEIVIVDLKRQRIVSRVSLEQAFYGLCFSPDGRRLFASGGEFEVVHAFDFEDGFLSRHREIPIVGVKEKFIPAGITTDQTGTTLIVAGPWGDRVCIAGIDTPGKQFISFEKESYPYACLADPSGKLLYVSLWNKAAVACVDPADKPSPACGRPKVIRPKWHCPPMERHSTLPARIPRKSACWMPAAARSCRPSAAPLSQGAGGKHAQQPLFEPRRTGAFCRQRRRQQCRRIQRRRPAGGQALGLHPRGLVSHVGPVQLPATAACTSPTAKERRPRPTRKGRRPISR